MGLWTVQLIQKHLVDCALVPHTEFGCVGALILPSMASTVDLQVCLQMPYVRPNSIDRSVEVKAGVGCGLDLHLRSGSVDL